MQKFVKYIRVSTKKQGKSGKGLAAQVRDIQHYLDTYSEPYEVIAEYQDIESGGDNDRTELEKAIALCKSEKATLLVSKLDRLSRRVSFIASLMEDKKLNFRVATMPTATEFQLHIYASLAHEERRFISTRTKAALAVAKEKGIKLGGARPEQRARHDAMRKQTDAYTKKLIKFIEPMVKSKQSYHSIARALTDNNVQTRSGGNWYAATVRNYYQRALDKGLI